VVDWFAVYRTSDGKLVSLTTVVPGRLDRGLAATPVNGPPAREVWNQATLTFDPKPPDPPEVDRVEEFIAAVGSSPSGATIRTELRNLLGPYRFRSSSEPGRLE